jgi:GINS complex subunit 4
MDIDISDILAEVSTAHASSAASLLSDSSTTAHDHQLLVRAWTCERAAPDLLPWPAELMQRVMQRVREQISRIEDMSSGGGAGYQGPAGEGGGNQNLNLVLSILQTDLSRTQFVVRSLLRQRLAKITRFAMFYLASLQAPGDTKRHLLSAEEVQFVQNHQALLGGLYAASFLDGFPGQLRRLDDASGGERMVEGPDGGASVFVRCLGEEWESGMGAGAGTVDDDYWFGEADEEGGVDLRMRKGEVWVVRWRDVRRGVLAGELELL